MTEPDRPALMLDRGVAGFLPSRGITLPWGDPADAPGRETVCGLGNANGQQPQAVEDGGHGHRRDHLAPSRYMAWTCSSGTSRSSGSAAVQALVPTIDRARWHDDVAVPGPVQAVSGR